MLSDAARFETFAHRKDKYDDPSTFLFEKRKATLAKVDFVQTETFEGKQYAWAVVGLRNNTSQFDASVPRRIEQMRNLLAELEAVAKR